MTLHADLLAWFDSRARDLPWRAGTSPWGVLVCEVMGQQTPMSRVVPRWHEWMARWPDPAALAAAPRADVVRAWDRLGYPRRALNLHRCAAEICERFGGVVPDDEDTLRSLPGVGAYTASAVAAFAFSRRTAVLDTNVRRVLGRLSGTGAPPSSITVAERQRATALLPEDPGVSARWSEALMELGALVCVPRPRCEACPVATHCGWLAAGRPAGALPPRRGQAFEGTDRQSRGRVLSHLRAVDAGWVGRTALIEAATVSDDAGQPARALASLVSDGLVSERNGEYSLGGDTLQQ